MKILTPRIFEQALIASTQAFKDLQPFFEYISQFTDNTIRCLSSNLGVRDNLDAEFKSVETPTQTTLKRVAFLKRPVGIVVVGGAKVTSFAWNDTGSNTPELDIQLATVPSNSTTILVLAFFS